MNPVKKPVLALVTKLAASVMYVGFSTFFLIWFTTTFLALIHRMTVHAPMIEYESGTMYFLGGGLFFVFLCISMWFSEKLSPQLNSILNKFIVCSIFVILILPHVMTAIVDHYVDKNGYFYCEAASSYSAKYSLDVFTQDIQTCAAELGKQLAAKHDKHQ